MKEQYVKVITRIFSLITGLGMVAIGLVWFQIQTEELPSTTTISTLPKEPPTKTTLEYQYWSTRTGKKYYPESCKYSQSIAESDRIYYTTATQAELYGKELSKRCLENV